MQGFYYMPSENKINFASGLKCKRTLHWVMKSLLNGLIERRCKTYLDISDWRWTFDWMAEFNIWTFLNFPAKWHFTSCLHTYDIFHWACGYSKVTSITSECSNRSQEKVQRYATDQLGMTRNFHCYSLILYNFYQESIVKWLYFSHNN